MAETTDDDKILSFDLHFAQCLNELTDFTNALNALYVSIWLLASGNDDEANKLYRHNYRTLLKTIADTAYPLEVTDEFRTQYQEQNNGND